MVRSLLYRFSNSSYRFCCYTLSRLDRWELFCDVLSSCLILFEKLLDVRSIIVVNMWGNVWEHLNMLLMDWGQHGNGYRKWLGKVRGSVEETLGTCSDPPELFWDLWERCLRNCLEIVEACLEYCVGWLLSITYFFDGNRLYTFVYRFHSFAVTPGF